MKLILLAVATTLLACGGTPPNGSGPAPSATVNLKLTEKDAGTFLFDGGTGTDGTTTGSTGTADVTITVKDGLMAIRVTSEGKLSYQRDCVYKRLSSSFGSSVFGSKLQYSLNFGADNGDCDLPDSGM